MTKCENMFHLACSGIQEGWLGHLKFQCSILEIDCCKNTKINNELKRGTGVVDKGCKNKSDSNGKYGNCSKGSLKRPRSPASFEKSGLTQEMRDRETAVVQTQAKSRIVLNGNSIVNKLSKKENLDRPLSSFVVPNRWVIEEILRKISMNPNIAWKKGKHGFKCSVMAPEFGKFVVNYWSKKCTVSLQGKNVGVVKQRIIEMLKKFPVYKRNQRETKPNVISSSIPSTGVDPVDLKRVTMEKDTHIDSAEIETCDSTGNPCSTLLKTGVEKINSRQSSVPRRKSIPEHSDINVKMLSFVKEVDQQDALDISMPTQSSPANAFSSAASTSREKTKPAATPTIESVATSSSTAC